jgi:hypothetical protein
LPSGSVTPQETHFIGAVSFIFRIHEATPYLLIL